MNRTEQLAEHYLAWRYPKSEPTYEPDGNVCPDFLVDGHAYEVTELVSVDEDGSANTPHQPSVDSLRRISRELCAGHADWTKYLWIKRPIKTKAQRKAIKRELKRLVQGAAESSVEEALLAQGIRIMHTSEFRGQAFEWGGASPFGEAGLVSHLFLAALQHAVTAKASKCAAAAKKYDALSLVVVNRNQAFLDEEDFAYTASEICLPDCFASAHVIGSPELQTHCRFERDAEDIVRWQLVADYDNSTMALTPTNA